MSNAWQDLEPEMFGQIYKRIWDSFYAKFAFHPSMEPSSWPGIKEPSPSVTYSISSLYGGDEDYFNSSINDLHEKALSAFRKCSKMEEPLYVLDWQHPAYLFFPHVPFAAEHWENWKTSVFPDGDYYIFINHDLSFGTFGHPWEQTICVFGEKLIHEFEKNLPNIFKEIRRN